MGRERETQTSELTGQTAGEGEETAAETERDAAIVSAQVRFL